MVRPNYKDYRRSQFVLCSGRTLVHSAKGSTWEEHKYIKRIDGTYYYPDSYEGGRHLSDKEQEETDKEGVSTEEINKKELSKNDIENLAKEVIRGNFGNGQQRMDLLGENYEEIQKRVNEILGGTVSSKPVSDATPESIKKAEDAAKNATDADKDASTSNKKTSTKSSNVHTGVDLEKVFSVYRNRKK